MFQEGYACLRGETRNNSREDYDAAVRAMLPLYRSMEAIMNTFGEHVAGDTVLMLYQNVDRINKRIMHHDPDEVIGWLERMQGELVAYCGRMRSMCNAALDAADFAALEESLRQSGFAIDRSEPLSVSDTSLPIAFAIIATKRP